LLQRSATATSIDVGDVHAPKRSHSHQDTHGKAQGKFGGRFFQLDKPVSEVTHNRFKPGQLAYNVNWGHLESNGPENGALPCNRH